MAKTSHVPLREAQFLTPIPELEVPWVGLQCLIVAFPDHIHFLEKCKLGYAIYQISRLYAMWL